MRVNRSNVRISCVVMLLAVVMSTSGCSIRRKEISEANMREVLTSVEQNNDLTPEEANLLKAYLIRHALNAASAPLPVTVGDAITKQRTFVAELEAREQAERAAAQRAEAERLARIAQLRAEVGVQLVRIEFIDTDIMARRFQDSLSFTVRVTNRSRRAVRGVRGTLVFLDTFGREVASIGMPVEEDIAAGASSDLTMTKDYNQFMSSDVAIRGFDLARGRVEWRPVQIVYADGTQVEVAAIAHVGSR